MTPCEIKERLNSLCEGLDDLVEQAPDLTAEELKKLIFEIASMSEERQLDEYPSALYALAKAIRIGRVDLVFVH
jgi:hypothetical protein